MTPLSDTGPAIAAIVGLLVYLLIAVGVYLWYALALSKLFPKLGAEGWKGWVPVLNDMEILVRGGVPGWSIVFAFIPFVNLYYLYLRVVAAHRIGTRFGRGAGTTVLAIVLPPLWATLLAGVQPVSGQPLEQRVAGYAPQAGGTPPVPPVPAVPAGLAAPVTPAAPAAPVPPGAPLPPAAAGVSASFGAFAASPAAVPPPAASNVAGPLPVAPAPAAPAVAPAASVPPALVEPPLVPPAVPSTPPAATPPAPAPAAERPVPVVPPAPVVAPAPVPAPAPAPVVEPAPAPPAVATAAPVAEPPVVPRVSPAPTSALAEADDDLGETIVVDRRPRIRYLLEVEGGPSIPLTADTVVLGRKPAAGEPGTQDVAVPDTTRTLSKVHARLHRGEEGWVITDLESTNGVVVVAPDGTETLLDRGASAVVEGRFILGKVAMSVAEEGARA